MTPDYYTPCPACPSCVRDLYAVGRRVLERLSDLHVDPNPEYAEFFAALEALRPFYEAHHANQIHAHSAELEDARLPHLEAA